MREFAFVNVEVASHAGAWIEIEEAQSPFLTLWSHLMQVRGLKYKWGYRSNLWSRISCRCVD